ncbi:Lysine histidine transporter-like 8 [Euphorbia peplus]|nr:Lysine histidine transporter-like 8 [Euphorbia peplus]
MDETNERNGVAGHVMLSSFSRTAASEPDESPESGRSSLSLSGPSSPSWVPLLTQSSEVQNNLDTPTGQEPQTTLEDGSPPIRQSTQFYSPVTTAFRLTKFDLQKDYCIVDQSDNEKKYYAAFHILCSGIGVQALVLPTAFTYLGWKWGIIILSIGFLWQFYTLWLLIQLHECYETGMRYSSYLRLITSAYGEKKARMLLSFPLLYLSGGSCSVLIIVGGSASKIFFDIICGAACSKKLTEVEWYLVFTTAAVLVSQLPDLNSIIGISLAGAVTAIGYCASIWLMSIAHGSLPDVSYDPIRTDSVTENVFGVLISIGIIAFSFRGHNLILEIQSTIPTDEKLESLVSMWKGLKVAYTVIALCLFPLAIGGYWAYGSQMPLEEGMLAALYKFHSHDHSKFVLGIISLFIIINSLISFQIYGMPNYEELESMYTSRKHQPCPLWLKALIRTLFGYSNMFPTLTNPIVGSVAAMAGSMGMPVTLVHPCFLWLKIKKPRMFSRMWFINWALGVSGICLTLLVLVASIYFVLKIGHIL